MFPCISYGIQHTESLFKVNKVEAPQIYITWTVQKVRFGFRDKYGVQWTDMNQNRMTDSNVSHPQYQT